jgi:hypothetical protein
MNKNPNISNNAKTTIANVAIVIKLNIDNIRIIAGKENADFANYIVSTIEEPKNVVKNDIFIGFIYHELNQLKNILESAIYNQYNIYTVTSSSNSNVDSTKKSVKFKNNDNPNNIVGNPQIIPNPISGEAPNALNPNHSTIGRVKIPKNISNLFSKGIPSGHKLVKGDTPNSGSKTLKIPNGFNELFAKRSALHVSRPVSQNNSSKVQQNIKQIRPTLSFLKNIGNPHVLKSATANPTATAKASAKSSFNPLQDELTKRLQEIKHKQQ